MDTINRYMYLGYCQMVNSDSLGMYKGDVKKRVNLKFGFICH